MEFKVIYKDSQHRIDSMRVEFIPTIMCLFQYMTNCHILKSSTGQNVQYSKSEVTCSHHLNLTDFEVRASCSIALQGKAKTGYPRVSRGSFLSGYRFFYVPLRTFFIYLFPSFRILTAAFTSRSIRFPHSHMYVRSDKASSFFLFPHTLHILLDAK